MKIAETDLSGTLPVRQFPINDNINFDSFEKSEMRDKIGLLKRIKFDLRRKDSINFKQY